MPELPSEDREFLLSGATQEEWDAAYPIEDEYWSPRDSDTTIN